jgi:tetratricopeptide (TPR) repeat protein
MKLMHILFSILIVFFAILPSFGADKESELNIFNQGNTAFQNGDFATAKKHYEDLIAKGYGSAELYYNLGTTEHKLDNTYKAYAYLTKAYKLNPRDQDISHNLQKLVKDNNLPDPGIKDLNFFLTTVSLENWILVFLSALTFTSLPVAVLLSGLKTGLIKWSIIIAGSISIILVFPLGFSFYDTYYNKSAIVVETAPVRRGPGSRFPTNAEVIPGSIIKLKNFSENGYHQVALPDGKQGYIVNSAFVEF